MITTIIPIKIPEKLTSNVQIKNFSNNNWNLVYNDDLLNKIDDKFG